MSHGPTRLVRSVKELGSTIQRRLAVAVALLLAVVVLGTMGYRIIVGGNLLDCLYMTVITIPGVGYGEILPGLSESAAGRMFTMFLIAAGVGLSAFLVSTLTALFVEGELTNMLRRRKMDKRIAQMRDHIVVCGAGSTGMHVIGELLAIGEPFVPRSRPCGTTTVPAGGSITIGVATLLNVFAWTVARVFGLSA